MKTFRRIISEVAQPSSEDELNFKEKHVIDHILDPNSEEDQFTADGVRKFYNRADYKRGEDMAVYEGVTLTRRDLLGQEDGDVNNDGVKNAIDAQLMYRRHAQIKNKIIDEESRADSDWEKGCAKVKKSKDPKFISKMIEKWGSRGGAWLNHPALTKTTDPVGQEDDDINNDGKVDKSDAYLRARRRAIARKLQQEGPTDVIEPVGGEYGDEEKSHVAYKKKNVSNPDHRGEPVEVKESDLHEVSKQTLKSYVKKAEKSYDSELNKAAKAGREMDRARKTNPGDADVHAMYRNQFLKHAGKSEKRLRGLIKADEKLAKEDVSLADPKTGMRVYAGKTKKSQVAEAFEEGAFYFDDGSTAVIFHEEAVILNSLFESLDESNREKMVVIATSCEAGLKDIVRFAKEVL